MDWAQACAYWERGAISTADLARTAYDLFEGEELDDVLHEIAAADPAAYCTVMGIRELAFADPFEPAGAPAPQGR